MRSPDLLLWKFLEKNINTSIPCALLMVVESEGSSPGRTGFKMAVNAQKGMAGSIGGGIMEIKIVEKVLKALREKTLQTHLIRQEHNKDSHVNQSGMICSGFQTILILPVLPEYLGTIKMVKEAFGNGEIISLSIKNSENTTIFEASKNTLSATNFDPVSENNYSYTELLGQKDKVVIIGGGHCSLELSELLNWLGFRVQIIETRPDINTLTSNTFVHKVVIMDSYDNILPLLPDKNTYIVVMTVGYRQDMTVLRQLLGQGYRYLGVLGSKQKIETLKATLYEEFSAEYLREMNAPIGIDISSKTTREIAVSIAGEIISLRNKKK